MKKTAILYLSLFLSTSIWSVFAQETFSIKGKVLDEKSIAAPFTSIILAKSDGQSMVKATITTEDGSYTIANVSKGNYTIIATMVGYQKYIGKPFDLAADMLLPDIQMVVEATLLQEATVAAQKPFLEQKIDKLVVNVANSPVAAGSTAMEVLQKVPGVIVINDRVTLAGKTGIAIMIDGKLSQYVDMSAVLKDIPSSNIEKIELIANPSAKYDASGNTGIINIILKRNMNLGTNGNISMTYGIGMYDQTGVGSNDKTYRRYNPNVSVNHRVGKINVFGNYSLLHRNVFEVNLYDRIIGNNRFSQTNYNPFEYGIHNFRGGVDYYLNKKNTIGFLVSGFVREGDGIVKNKTNLFDNATNKLKETFSTDNYSDINRKNTSFNANFKHTFDSTGKEFNLDLDYATYNFNNQSIITITSSDLRKSVGNQDLKNPIFYSTIKGDYTHPFSKNAKLESGFKFSMANIDNTLLFTRGSIVDNTRSNTFIYDENINAAYTNIFLNKAAWEIQAGLRVEQTISKGKQSTNGELVLDRNYTQLFPSLFITRRINKDIASTLSFSRRIDRPGYQQQNPFEFYIDSLTFMRGNPNLQPQTTNASKLALTFQGMPFFSVSYNRTYNIIFENAPRQEGNITYTVVDNLGKYENFTSELNFPIKFGKMLDGFGGFQVINNKYDSEYLGSTYLVSKWHWLCYSQLNFKFSKTVSAEVSGFYTRPFLMEFLQVKQISNVNIGVQKTLWDKRGKIGISANDIFYRNRLAGNILYQNINVAFAQRSDTRNIRINFSYSFGNTKVKGTRERNVGSDGERRRVKNID